MAKVSRRANAERTSAGPWLAVVGAVIRRPWLWPTALRTASRLRPRRGSRRYTVPAEYLRFRNLTNTGQPDGPPAPADVVAYLSWCRTFPASARPLGH